MNDFENFESKSILGDNTFKIRLAIAVVLLTVIMLLDISNKSFAGITMERLYQAIAVDYGMVIDIFVQNVNVH